MKFKFMTFAVKSWADWILGALVAAPVTVRITRNYKARLHRLVFIWTDDGLQSAYMAEIDDRRMTSGSPTEDVRSWLREARKDVRDAFDAEAEIGRGKMVDEVDRRRDHRGQEDDASAPEPRRGALDRA